MFPMYRSFPNEPYFFVRQMPHQHIIILEHHPRTLASPKMSGEDRQAQLSDTRRSSGKTGVVEEMDAVWIKRHRSYRYSEVSFESRWKIARRKPSKSVSPQASEQIGQLFVVTGNVAGNE